MKTIYIFNYFLYCCLNKRLVREVGLEPTRRKTLDPKSSASANFATLANLKIYKFCALMSILFKAYQLKRTPRFLSPKNKKPLQQRGFL